MTTREVVEGLLHQSSKEQLAYKITTTPWGTNPSSVTATAFDITSANEQDVTSTVFPVNTPSTNGDVVTLSPLRELVRNHIYRISVQFTVGSNVMECFFRVRGQA